jgi:CSLREA domain-containing protein
MPLLYRQRWSRPLIGLLVAGALVVAWPVGRAAAQTSPNVFFVTSTADLVDSNPGDGACATSQSNCTLRAAIMEANTLGGRQTINLPSGTYLLTRTGSNEDAARRGDLDITGDLTILGDRDGATIIDGNDSSRAFHIRAIENLRVTIRDVTIRGGNAAASSGEGPFFQLGGGIYIDGAHQVSLSRVIIRDNRATSSGAVHVATQGRRGGTLFISSSRLERNRSDSGAGALFTPVPTTIRNSVIRGNQAGGSGVSTGGIDLFSNVAGTLFTIDRTEISNNTGRSTGGIALIGGATAVEAQLTNVTISGNTATNRTGGGTIRISGGINVQGTGGLNMDNVTVVNNSGAVGGIAAEGAIGATNSIIANNDGGDCAVNRLVGDTNIIGGSSCRFLSGSGNRSNINPLVGPLALNGASNGTRSHALLTGSPALEQGGNARCPSRDQRGIRRPSGARCDIGAFEKELQVLLGTAALTPTASAITANQTTTLTLSWTVPPTMTWTDLRTLDLQLDTGDRQPVVVRFSQGVTATDELSDTEEIGEQQPLTPRDTLTLFDTDGTAGSGTLGDTTVLEGEGVALDVAQSRLLTDGPNGTTATLTLALRFKQPLRGTVYTMSLLASTDNGDMQGPEQVGTLAVGPFSTLMPLVAR